MAEGRMLKKKISLNEALADLSNDSHRLLFTWGIPHLDVEGRVTGSPRRFKALVAPLLEHITPEVVLAFFNDAESKGLIQRYETDGDWHLQYPKFHDNQNLTKSREAPSKRPAPPKSCQELNEDSMSDQRALDEDSPGTQPEVKLSKENLSEGKINTPTTPLARGVPFCPQKLAELWNEKAPPEMSRVNLPFKRSPKAMAHIKDALKRNQEPEWWEKVLQRMWNSPFLRGFSERGWKADIDFMAKKAEEIIDGKYDQGKGPPPKGFSAVLNFAQRSIVDG